MLLAISDVIQTEMCGQSTCVRERVLFAISDIIQTEMCGQSTCVRERVLFAISDIIQTEMCGWSTCVRERVLFAIIDIIQTEMGGQSTCGQESRPVVGVKRYLGYLSFDIIQKQGRWVAKVVESMLATAAFLVQFQKSLRNT